MNAKYLVVAAVVLIVLGGGAWYLTQNQTSTQTLTPPVTSTSKPTEDVLETTNSSDSAMAEGVKEINIESQGLKFTKTEIRVKKGETVRLTYKNNQGNHDWTIDEFNAKTKVLAAGQQETIEFVADKTGSFEYYCSVPGHRAAGLKGMLIVE